MLADQMSSTMITPYDLKRLEQYASNMADYHLIMDLVPSLAKLHFLYEVENLNKPNLGAVQQAILAGIGLQCKSVDTLASELDVPASQLLGLMNTMLRKYTAKLRHQRRNLRTVTSKDKGYAKVEVSPFISHVQ